MGKMLEMTSLKNTVIRFNSSDIEQIPKRVLPFLKSLTGLTVIDVPGKDINRWRVVTTLIHGNEPSGFIACHLWLLAKEVPATNIRIIFCNPEAAQSLPFFTNRYVEHSEDLNRFFNPTLNSASSVAVRAARITALIKEVEPEAIVDLHNTSGNSPAFAVSISESKKHKQLVKLFTDSLILTNLHVGAVMEQSFDAPIVTIECGGATENSSHEVASSGLYQFFNLRTLFADEVDNLHVRRHPVRIELINDTSVGFAHHRLTTTDITLRADIETLNREITPKEEFIGWCEPDEPLAIKAIDENGHNKIDDFFENRNGCLFTKVDLQLFMVTTVPEIATRDCLFYTTLDTSKEHRRH
jgi:hypothetical protein